MRTPILLLTALAFTGCWEDLPAGDFTSPYYWSDVFLDKYADELVVGDLEPGPAPLEEPRTVLLITGVTIKAKWFDPIVARLKRDGFVPVVYEPPELLSGNLFQASADLGKVVERVVAESGQDKIDILAECTGGVIARYYIQSLGGDRLVSRLVTFVSPQHGVDKAPWAEMIAGWPALTDLSPGSAFLEAVNNAPLPADVPITSIYTCGDEYIRPYQTSIIPGATNIGLCDDFVGHFQTFYDPAIYLIMHDALIAPTPADAAEPDETADDDAPVTDDDSDAATDPAATPASDPAATPAPDPVVTGSSASAADSASDPSVPEQATNVEGMGCAGAPSSGLGIVMLVLLAALVGKRQLTSAGKRTNHQAP